MNKKEKLMGKVRIWKLGILDGVNSIIPTRAAVVKLRELVKQLPEDGIGNIVWGPELEVIELGDNYDIDNYVVEKFTVSEDTIELKARKV